MGLDLLPSSGDNFTPVGLASILNLWWLVAILSGKQWPLVRRSGLNFDNLERGLKAVSKGKGYYRNTHH